MYLKLGLFVIFLLLFQCIEAKKKKQTNSATASLTTYIKDLKTLLQDAWDSLLELVPAAPQTKPKKRTKKKKKKHTNWDLNDYVKSATKKFNHFYKSMSDSLGVLQLGRSGRPPPDSNGEEVFTVELFAAEVIENATRGLIRIVDSFASKE